MAKQRTYSRYASEAALLMGEQIKLGRKRRRWTEQDLAARAGISRGTLQKIEKGDLGCALGLVFEVAVLAGLELFEQEGPPFSSLAEQTRDQLTLLPRRIRPATRVVDDDF